MRYCSWIALSNIVVQSDLLYKDTLFIDLLLHPRVPPIVRSLPTIDAIALRKSDESIEEGKLRKALGLDEMENSMDVDGDMRNIEDGNNRVEVQATAGRNIRGTEFATPKTRPFGNTHDDGDNNPQMLVDRPSVSSENPVPKPAQASVPDASTPITQTLDQQMAEPLFDGPSKATDSERFKERPAMDPVSEEPKPKPLPSYQDHSSQKKANPIPPPKEPANAFMNEDSDDDEFPAIDPRSDTESEPDSEQ